jgi:hypothetical protein
MLYSRPTKSYVKSYLRKIQELVRSELLARFDLERIAIAWIKMQISENLNNTLIQYI